jgi:hypothetical protein
MKKVVILAAVGMLIAGAAGCQSRRSFPWRNAPGAAATYNGMAAPSLMYSDPGLTASPSPRPAGGCGPGCSSCGGSSPQVLSGPQAFVPNFSTGSGLGQ